MNRRVVQGLLIAAMVGASAAPGLAQSMEPPSTIVEGPGLSAPDRAFARGASQDGQYQLGLAMLAQEKTLNDQVKSLAEALQQDQQPAIEKLKSIAQSKDLPLPDVELQAAANHRAAIARLDGRTFDRAFVQSAIDLQRRIILAFEQYGVNGRDRDFMQYARDRLPTLRRHLTRAEDVRAAIGHP